MGIYKPFNKTSLTNKANSTKSLTFIPIIFTIRKPTNIQNKDSKFSNTLPNDQETEKTTRDYHPIIKQRHRKFHKKQSICETLFTFPSPWRQTRMQRGTSRDRPHRVRFSKSPSSH